jgi:hypothetical protein
MPSEEKKQLLRRCLMVSLSGVSILLIVTVWLGFRADSPTLIRATPRLASRIFEGFSYAGEDLPNTPLGAHTSRLLPFRLKAQTIPRQFVAGHNYLFHHPMPEDDGARIAEQVLAPRLRQEGFVLTEGVKVNGIFYKGFATIDYAGGGGITLWSIQFKRDASVGIEAYDSDFGIRANPWPVVRKTWDPADYILRIEGTCDL